MDLFYKVIMHFVGNIAMWLYYGSRKSIDEVAEKDNSTLGLVLAIILGCVLFSIFNTK